MTFAKKFLAVAVAGATLATASVVTTTQAEARGGAFVAGLVGGAIIGGAVAAHAYRPYYYAPGYYYAPAPVYVAPRCKKVWVNDGYGRMVKVRAC